MKKLFTLAATVVCLVASAQRNRIEVSTPNDVSTFNMAASSILDFRNDSLLIRTYRKPNHATLIQTDTFKYSEVRKINFVMDNPIHYNIFELLRTDRSTRGDDWSYGSAMLIRETMLEDFVLPNNNYNWFYSWSMNDVQEGNGGLYYLWKFFSTSLDYINTELVKMQHPGRPESYDAYEGCLYALRALEHLDLSRMYEYLPNKAHSSINEAGNNVMGLTAPIFDHPLDRSTTFCIPRATKADMCRFILEDLNRAEQLVGQLQNSDRQLPHLECVYGLKARCYLWMGDYANARLYARKAIDTYAGQPMSKDDCLSPTRGFNSLDQWMWGLEYSRDDAKLYRDLGMKSWTSWLSPEMKESYAEEVPAQISSALYSRIADTDFRKLWWKAPEDSPLNGLVTSNNEDALRNHPVYTSFKFRPKDGNYQDLSGVFSAFPLMRVEEMYLIEAEAAARENADEGKHLLTTFMTQYRDKAYTCQATTTEEVVDEIFLQKRIELWGEGQLFFDYKRLNKSVTRSSQNGIETNWDQPFIFDTDQRPAWLNLQFPTSELNANIALVDWNNPKAYLYNDYTAHDGNDQPEEIVNPDIKPHHLSIALAQRGVIDLDSLINFKCVIQSDNEGMTRVGIEASFSPDMSDAFLLEYSKEGIVYSGYLKMALMDDWDNLIGREFTLYLRSKEIYLAYGVYKESYSNIVPVTCRMSGDDYVATDLYEKPRLLDATLNYDSLLFNLKLVDTSSLPSNLKYSSWLLEMGSDNEEPSWVYLSMDENGHLKSNFYDLRMLLDEIKTAYANDETFINTGVVNGKLSWVVDDDEKGIYQITDVHFNVPMWEKLLQNDGLMIFPYDNKNLVIEKGTKVFVIKSQCISNDEPKVFRLHCDQEGITIDSVSFDYDDESAYTLVHISGDFQGDEIVIKVDDANDLGHHNELRFKYVESIWYYNEEDFKNDGYTQPFPLKNGVGTYYSAFFEENLPDTKVGYCMLPNGTHAFRITPSGENYSPFIAYGTLREDGNYDLTVAPTVMVYEHSQYGPIYLNTDRYSPSTFNPETGVFTLNLEYNVSIGSFDTFSDRLTLDGSQAGNATSRSFRQKVKERKLLQLKPRPKHKQ